MWHGKDLPKARGKRSHIAHRLLDRKENRVGYWKEKHTRGMIVIEKMEDRGWVLAWASESYCAEKKKKNLWSSSFVIFV